MIRTIISSLYKLFKDRAFRITLIIGVLFAVISSLINNYTGINSMLYNSSPIFSFGICIPFNITAFVIGEFNYGTIRNKIIAGHRRISIYLSLLLTAIIYTVIVMTAYLAIATTICTIKNGFGSGITPKIVFAVIIYCLAIFVALSAISVFVSSVVRHTGLSNTLLMALEILGGFIFALSFIFKYEGGEVPLYLVGLNPLFLSTDILFEAGIFNNFDVIKTYIIPSILGALGYTLFFSVCGIFAFYNRDVK
ncbi:MAG: hypothetical protein K6C32_02385 [Bacilli bacterium]|nr:hypothetical protein [Bacilli bacterium]